MRVPSTAVGARMYLRLPARSHATSGWFDVSRPPPRRFSGLVQSSFANCCCSAGVMPAPAAAGGWVVVGAGEGADAAGDGVAWAWAKAGGTARPLLAEVGDP